MGTSGKLTKENFGYSVPVNAPLYKPFPVRYRDARVLSISYVTDVDAAAAFLPCQLEFEQVPIVTAIFADYPWSTVGSYLEVAQVLSCKFHGRDVIYAVHFHVTTDAAMAAGREIAGFPKKIGDIGFSADESYESHLDCPAGVRICSANFTPSHQLPTPPPGSKQNIKEYVSLRVIPNPQDTSKPSLRQLIGTEWVLGPGMIWSGSGACHFTGISSADPYHKLPVRTIVSSTLFFGALTASRVTFVEDF